MVLYSPLPFVLSVIDEVACAKKNYEKIKLLPQFNNLSRNTVINGLDTLTFHVLALDSDSCVYVCSKCTTQHACEPFAFYRCQSQESGMEFRYERERDGDGLRAGGGWPVWLLYVRRVGWLILLLAAFTGPWDRLTAGELYPGPPYPSG